jgi:hypothetical protein
MRRSCDCPSKMLDWTSICRCVSCVFCNYAQFAHC